MRNVLLLVLGVVVGIVVVAGALVALPFVMPRDQATLVQVAAGPTSVAVVASATATAVPATQAPSSNPAPTVTRAATPTAAAVAPTTAGTARLLAEEAAIVELYERVSPAVVNITNRRGVPGSGEFPRSGAGSGVIFDAKGFILTNNHVVDDASRLEVTLADGSNFAGKLLGRDPANDLAIVQLEAPPEKLEKLAVAPLGDSDALKPGQIAVAIGSPFGLERTITVGIVSATGRARPNEGRRTIANMIQTDAPINPGNSGGPLLNSKGEVVGINTAIESPVRGSVGIGFAVPINTAKLFIPEMLTGKTVKHPYLGITGMPLTPQTAQDLGLSVTEGVYVTGLEPNGPARKAGIRGGTGGSGTELPKGGDVILSIDGQKVSRTDSITAYLDTRKVGDVVKVEVLREGNRQTIELTLEEWPETQAPRGTPGR